MSRSRKSTGGATIAIFPTVTCRQLLFLRQQQRRLTHTTFQYVRFFLYCICLSASTVSLLVQQILYINQCMHSSTLFFVASLNLIRASAFPTILHCDNRFYISHSFYSTSYSSHASFPSTVTRALYIHSKKVQGGR